MGGGGNGCKNYFLPNAPKIISFFFEKLLQNLTNIYFCKNLQNVFQHTKSLKFPVQIYGRCQKKNKIKFNQIS